MRIISLDFTVKELGIIYTSIESTIESDTNKLNNLISIESRTENQDKKLERQEMIKYLSDRIDKKIKLNKKILGDIND